jgi:nucleoside-triphosphatase THEP1
MNLYLLTAEIGAGKTTFCAALAQQGLAAGWDVAGILCPPAFENGIKTGFSAQNLRTGETRPLAVSVSSDLRPLTFDLSLGNWLFSPSTLAWGNEVLATALPCDLFIVDELGPLELIRGEGWINALEALRQPTYKFGVVVIRPSLLETAQKIFLETQVLSMPKNAHEFYLSLPGV